ncbi:hypothetical protein [Nostoc sp. NOS(2021)]|nr:hypothetical protein [Nostoc sp. NOS(2021)]
MTTANSCIAKIFVNGITRRSLFRLLLGAIAPSFLIMMDSKA